MRWRTIPALVLSALLAVTGCGDDGDPMEPGISLELVTGVYDITRLTFDPSGSLGEKDIAGRLGRAISPQLVIGRDGRFQIAYTDPATLLIDPVHGRVQPLTGGVRLEFDSTQEAQKILLPRRLDLELDQAAGTLSFTGEVDVALTRLIAFVPEFAEEQLRDPVRGTLSVQFTRRAASSEADR